VTPVARRACAAPRRHLSTLDRACLLSLLARIGEGEKTPIMPRSQPMSASSRAHRTGTTDGQSA
jgi:hypothetical protein